MKFKFLLILSILFSVCAQAKVAIDTVKTDSLKKEKKEVVNDTTAKDTIVVYWTEKNTLGANLSEVAFVNWNAGGNNSVSALFYGNIERNYKKDLMKWKNSANFRYGINAQQGREIRKTDDEMRFDSSFGFRKDSTSNWFYSGKFNFRTQFTTGYKYPDTETTISEFMAPGYAFLGAGTEFSHPTEDLTAYFSPITFKGTFVLDQRLADEGSFGVTPAEYDEEGNLIKRGENMRTEFGILITGEYKKEVFENINVSNQLSLYSDYLNKFGNIDVDWQLDLNLKVNDFVKASVGGHIRYDDDVKFKEDLDGDGDLETTGPRIQLKQMLGVGVVYEF